MLLPARNSKAFTLLELIVVIVILGILAAIAVPSFQKVIVRSQDSATETTLSALLREAQALAAFENRAVTAADIEAASEDLTIQAVEAGTYAAPKRVAAWLDGEVNAPATATRTDLLYKVDGNVAGVSLASASGNCVFGQVTGVSSGAETWVGSIGTCTGTSAVAGPGSESATAPGAPTAVTATGGDAEATVSFAPPSSDGGAAVTSYTVTSSPGGLSAVGASSPITVTGLTNGTGYTFTVTASNSVGTSSPSAPSNVVYPAASVQAVAWGRNTNGELGDGTVSTNRLSPVGVQGLPGAPSQIDGGRDFSCALVNGGAWCWGKNTAGQLGNGTATASTVPVQVVGMASGVTHIAAGQGANACAVQSGAVKCWGDNSHGQLGDGTTTASLTPVQVSGLTSDASMVSAGDRYACAVHAGSAKCWGLGGALGDGTVTQRLTPVQVTGLTADVTVISSGYMHTCAVHGGVGKCWGGNSLGQLGTGNTTSYNSPVTILTSNVSSISAGLYHTCAAHGGAAKCWGDNGGGQLGDGTITQRTSPTQVSGLTSGVSSPAAGGGMACVVHDGAAKCWGHNANGEVGDGTTTQRRTPVQVLGLTSGVTSLDAGVFHLVARQTISQ